MLTTNTNGLREILLISIFTAVLSSNVYSMSKFGSFPDNVLSTNIDKAEDKVDEADNLVDDIKDFISDVNSKLDDCESIDGCGKPIRRRRSQLKNLMKSTKRLKVKLKNVITLAKCDKCTTFNEKYSAAVKSEKQIKNYSSNLNSYSKRARQIASEVNDY